MNLNINYKQKYSKYKQKYLELKQLGGVPPPIFSEKDIQTNTYGLGINQKKESLTLTDLTHLSTYYIKTYTGEILYLPFNTYSEDLGYQFINIYINNKPEFIKDINKIAIPKQITENKVIDAAIKKIKEEEQKKEQKNNPKMEVVNKNTYGWGKNMKGKPIELTDLIRTNLNSTDVKPTSVYYIKTGTGEILYLPFSKYSEESRYQFINIYKNNKAVYIQVLDDIAIPKPEYIAQSKENKDIDAIMKKIVVKNKEEERKRMNESKKEQAIINTKNEKWRKEQQRIAEEKRQRERERYNMSTKPSMISNR